MSCFDGDELGEELRLIDVQAATFGVGETPWSDFSGSAVVEDAGVPCAFDAVSRGRYTAAGLAGDDDFIDGKVGKLDLIFGGNFGEAERVGGRAANGGDLGVMDQLDASQAGETAAGNH
jgi:hypothetical protein